MAGKSVATGATLIQNVVEEKVWRETMIETYFDKFTSTGPDNIVELKRDLAKDTGEKITFGLVKRLVGSGVDEGEQLEGNEEAIQDANDLITLAYKRHAVKIGTVGTGRISIQRSKYKLEPEAKSALTVWGAEYIDGQHFDALFDAAPSKVLYRDGTAGDFKGTDTLATAVTAMSATNSVITPEFLSAIKTWGKTGGDRAINPLRPIKVKGKSYWVLLVAPNVTHDLRQNTIFQNALKDARERSDNNPLFNDAVAVWEGVVIHDHESVPEASDGGGAAVHYSRGALMGAQALCHAAGMSVPIVRETMDYGDQIGIAWGLINKIKKPTFDSKNYGSVNVVIACENVSGV